MAHNHNADAHAKAARRAFRLVKRQAVGEDELSTPAGRQPLPTSSDEDIGLAPVRGPALSTGTSPAVVRTTARRTTARTSAVTSTEIDIPETTSSPVARTTAPSTSTSSSSTRLAPVRTITSSTTSSSSSSSSSTTSSAGRSSPTQASSTAGIADSTSANDSNGADTGSKSNGGAIAGAIIAVIAVLLIAAFFGWRYWKKKKNARLANGGLGESDTFYPYASGGAASGDANDKNGNNGAYNQRINSFEELASNAASANGGGYNGEKYGQNGGGYGTMGSHDDEKAFGALGAGAAAGAGFGAMNRQKSAEQENFAGRGLSPYNSLHSFSQLPSNGLQGLNHNNASPQMNGPNGYGGNDSYPPTPQQQAHYSQQGTIFSNAPNAAMMGHPAVSENGYNGFNNDHLPQHQDRALGNAIDAYGSQNGLNNNNGNAAALAAAGLAAGGLAGAAATANDNSEGQQQGPFADPATEGKTYIVTRIFEPSMPDELVIYPGDRIQIVVPYDDGWCLGCNLTTAEREGTPPATGVFPRDCVEEWTPELEKMMNGEIPAESAPLTGLAPVLEGEEQRPTSVASDVPLNLNDTTDLQRAPTLPPLNMGDNSRFSMTSANNKRTSHISNNNRPASLVPGNVPLPASIKSPVSATVSLPGGDEEDIYGGVSDDIVTPVSKTFPPNIQVSKDENSVNGSSSAPIGENDNGNKRESVAQFGSSYHIADYASRLGDEDDNSASASSATAAAVANNKRLSTLDEESNANEEFPSTPRTMSATAASPRFSGVSPALSATPGQARSPAPSAQNNYGRLSVVDVNHHRLSVGSNLMPSSQSVKSLKRTSSLIAGEDAKTFLA